MGVSAPDGRIRRSAGAGSDRAWGGFAHEWECAAVRGGRCGSLAWPRSLSELRERASGARHTRNAKRVGCGEVSTP